MDFNVSPSPLGLEFGNLGLVILKGVCVLVFYFY